MTFSKKRDRYPSDKRIGSKLAASCSLTRVKVLLRLRAPILMPVFEFFARTRRDVIRLNSRQGEGRREPLCDSWRFAGGLNPTIKGGKRSTMVRKKKKKGGYRRDYWEYSWRCKFCLRRWMFYVSNGRKMETFRFLIVTLLIQAIKDLLCNCMLEGSITVSINLLLIFPSLRMKIVR